ncbi:MAG: glycerate-2-kinase family protein, partial [bacterium]
MSSQLRQQALSLYQSGLASITPDVLVRDALSLEADALVLNYLDGRERIALPSQGRVLLVSVGKAAVSMAVEARRIFGEGITAERITDGIVVTKHGFAGTAVGSLPWPVMESGHPVPDEAGVEAAKAVSGLLQDTGPDDTVLVMVSGGASALLPAPVAGISLADKQALVGAMLRVEMDIHQINTVRKAVSRLKGGGLAALAAPSRVVGLYLSDVPGDRLASIGSGPTIPEPVDFPAVVALLREKDLWERVPKSVREVLAAGRTPRREP